jgi:hypothetical protein
VIAVEPTATPVTVTVVDIWPAGIVAEAVTVATPASALAKLRTMPPAGAAAEIEAVTLVLRVAVTVTGDGLNVMANVARTVAEAVTGTYPAALAVIVAEPTPAPVTAAVAEVAPPEMVTGEATPAMPGAELTRVIVTPPAGAGLGIETTRFAWRPRPMVRTAGARPRTGRGLTVTLAPAPVKPLAVALTVVAPTATAATLKAALVWPSGMVTDAGTVATPLALLAKLTTKPPAGAGLGIATVRVPWSPRKRSSEPGVSVRTAANTFAVAVASAKPPAVAVMTTEPAARPVTVAQTLVCPSGIVIEAVTVATAGAWLVRVTTTPPAPAAAGRLTVSPAVPPARTGTGLGLSVKGGGTGTVTIAVAWPPLREAVSVAVRAPRARIGKMAVAVLAGTVTLGGATTTPAWLVDTLTLTSFAGTGATVIVNVRPSPTTRLTVDGSRPVTLGSSGVTSTSA